MQKQQEKKKTKYTNKKKKFQNTTKQKQMYSCNFHVSHTYTQHTHRHNMKTIKQISPSVSLE